MATAKQQPTEASAPEWLEVLGAGVVLKNPDGGEKYLYLGPLLTPADYKPESIKHATTVGLIGPAQ